MNNVFKYSPILISIADMYVCIKQQRFPNKYYCNQQWSRTCL